VCKQGEKGLTSCRCSAAGGSGGAGLPEEEGSSEEEDDEDICYSRAAVYVPPVAEYLATGQVREPLLWCEVGL